MNAYLERRTVNVQLTEQGVALAASLREADEFAELSRRGKMKSGKSTIVRLTDFCLGGDIELTPALQSEFVYAALTLEIEDRSLFIKRDIDAITQHMKQGAMQVTLNNANRAG